MIPATGPSFRTEFASERRARGVNLQAAKLPSGPWSCLRRSARGVKHALKDVARGVSLRRLVCPVKQWECSPTVCELLNSRYRCMELTSSPLLFTFPNPARVQLVLRQRWRKLFFRPSAFVKTLAKKRWRGSLSRTIITQAPHSSGVATRRAATRSSSSNDPRN